MQFKDRVQPYKYEVSSSNDETRKSQDSDLAPLGEFFSRPIKIAEFEWGTGVSLGDDFDPWSLFFENERVINRLTNFNLLRCNLRLRVLINGNAFQYGRGIMYYRPMDAFDQMSTDSALIRQDLIAGSQCPHIYLDPTTSQGGELVLPFFYYKNYVRIPDAEWSELGRVYLRSFNDLKHANGASDKVTISVFAMAEDVQATVLTTLDSSALEPQSDLTPFEPQGEFEEANKTGMISGPATMVAKLAGALSTVPAISPFALATQMVANATAKAARIFGYCRPAISKSPEPYKPQPTSSLALTNAPDTTMKLTVDDKQELSIDPSISGIQSYDPLNIRGIASRESYLTTFTWAVGTAPDSFLWNSRVVPTLWDTSTAGNAIHMTPACFAAIPFEYWTGSMKFRFQIVASNYHRGRLRFVWDPNYIMDRATNYNIAHQTIVDISEERDFTMEIANGQEYTLLDMFEPSDDVVGNVYSSTAEYGVKRAGNGVIGVYVLNELTVPNSTVNNDIQINVFVSAGDDFEVFMPSDKHLRYTAADFVPQSGMEPQSDTDDKVDTPHENTEEPSAPIQKQVMQMHAVSDESPKLNMVFTGEAIASFRPLIKRYAMHTSRGALGSGNVCVSGTMPQYPYLRGGVLGAVNTTGTGDPYNYANTLLLHWITWPFAGYRGSTRWKILPRGNRDNSQPMALYAERQTDRYPATYAADADSQENYSTDSEAADSVVQHPFTGRTRNPPVGALGMAYATSDVNPTLEVEVPFYSRNRFVPGKVLNHTGDRTARRTPAPWTYRMFLNGEPSTALDFACAAGDDFQVYFWTGVPRLYFETSPPAPEL